MTFPEEPGLAVYTRSAGAPYTADVANESAPEPGPRPGTLARVVRDAVRGLSPRERWGWALTVLGIAVILAGVLHLTNATIGGPIHEFRERRVYNQVKTAAHEAIPVTFALGLGGLAIAVLGGRLRASGRRSRGGA
jgi:hypothetical protein